MSCQNIGVAGLTVRQSDSVHIPAPATEAPRRADSLRSAPHRLRSGRGPSPGICLQFSSPDGPAPVV